MSKRFFTKINNKGRLVIIDKECHTELFDMTLVCDVLNRLDLKLKHYNEVNGEQQATITELERKLNKYEKIGEEQLKQIIDLQDELNECRARPTLATDERGVVKVEYR